MRDESSPVRPGGATLRALGGHGPHHRRLAAAVMATAPSPAQQEAAKFSQICRNCAKPTAIIEDHQQGDLVCTECGLVLESRVVDESSEWRTFSDSDKGGMDPSRTAGPTNRMLAGGGLATSIGKNPDGTYNQTLTRLHNAGRNPDRAMLAAFSKIGELADHLGMTSVVKDGACDIYRMVVKPGQPVLGKSQNAMFAACLYISCRQEGTNRTFKEICGGAQNTTVKEIGKCYKYIVKCIDGLNTQMMEQMITPEKLTNRFCGNLGLANLSFSNWPPPSSARSERCATPRGTPEKQPAPSRRRRCSCACSCTRARRRRGWTSGRSPRFPGWRRDYPRSYEDMYPHAARMLPEAYKKSGENAGAGTEQEERDAPRRGSTRTRAGGRCYRPFRQERGF